MGMILKSSFSDDGWPPCSLRPQVPWDSPHLGCLSAEDRRRAEYLAGRVSSEPLRQGVAMQPRPCLYPCSDHTLV